MWWRDAVDQIIKAFTIGWITLVSYTALIQDVLAFIGVACGAILGVHSVWMLWKGWRHGRKQKGTGRDGC